MMNEEELILEELSQDQENEQSYDEIVLLTQEDLPLGNYAFTGFLSVGVACLLSLGIGAALSLLKRST
jgi:hypothetical protein